jgi:regulator of protease activity HflC (stomatin/prohibitin superfamily)
MEQLYYLSWREYPALALAILGVVLAAWAVQGERQAMQRYRFGTDRRLITLLRDFRRAVIGLALIGIAAGWYWHVPVFLAIAILLGAGETFEATNDIFNIERAVRLSPRADLEQRA